MSQSCTASACHCTFKTIIAWQLYGPAMAAQTESHIQVVQMRQRGDGKVLSSAKTMPAGSPGAK